MVKPTVSIYIQTLNDRSIGKLGDEGPRSLRAKEPIERSRNFQTDSIIQALYEYMYFIHKSTEH